MKITVAKSDLEAALQIAGVGLGKNDGDLSSHYLFRVRDGGVEVLTQNEKRICMMVPLKGCTFEGDEGAAMTIEGWRLMRWLGGVRTAGQPVDLSCDSNGHGEMKAERTTITFQGLDPSLFPFFDVQLGEARESTKMASSKMASALGYAHPFVFDQETVKPQISQVEVIEGNLWATDKKAVTLISSEKFEGAKFRIHGKDVPVVARYLTVGEDNEVQVLEHERSVFLRREDGSVMGVTRPFVEFPPLKVSPDESDEGSIEVNTDEMAYGIKCLSAAAPKDNRIIRFLFDAKKDKVVMAVDSVAGSRDTYELECVSKENAHAVPDEGFCLDYLYLEKIMGHFPSSETLTFGINKKGRGGFARFRNVDSDGDLHYMTVVVWKI